jgi:hypothetical protein
VNFFFSLSAATTFTVSALRRAKVSLTFNNLVDSSASGGRVALAASAFRLAKTFWALVFLATFSAVTAILLDLLFREV